MEFVWKVLTMSYFHSAALLPKSKIQSKAMRDNQLYKENLTQNMQGCAYAGERRDCIYQKQDATKGVCLCSVRSVSTCIFTCKFMHNKIGLLFIYVFTIRSV